MWSAVKTFFAALWPFKFVPPADIQAQIDALLAKAKADAEALLVKARADAEALTASHSMQALRDAADNNIASARAFLDHYIHLVEAELGAVSVTPQPASPPAVEAPAPSPTP